MITRNLRIFFTAFVFSLPVWWAVNVFSSELTEFFFRYDLRTNPETIAAFAAQRDLAQQLERQYPLIKKGVVQPEIQAGEALSTFIRPDGTLRILYKKDEHEPLLIASLTKLMTSLVALKLYAPTQEIVITRDILKEQGETGNLREGDVFSVKDLLYLTLMESSNDAASALAEPLGRTLFIQYMQEQAANLDMKDTSFTNPTGLDPLAGERGNYSTAADLTKLAMHLMEQHPQVFDILSQEELDLYTLKGEFHHTMKSTNTLLHYSEWPAKTLGGKTGSTPQAKESLILLLESPDYKGYIVNVVLGSEDRFLEMQTLLGWILQSYQWQT